MTRTLRLATRGSRLAVAQSRWVANRIAAAHPGVEIELLTVRTTGDAVRDRPLYDIGGKGLFTKEVEQALLRGEADLAVHSYKDLPTTMPLVDDSALVVAAVPGRADPRDVTATRDGRPLADLPAGARVGTTSPRRAALVREAGPDLRVVPLRGNVGTRVAKLESAEVDCVVLAKAGLDRLGGLDPRLPPPRAMDPAAWVPAAGQGALAVQCREADAGVRAVLAAIDDPESRRAVGIEREVVRLLEGDCTSPIGAWFDGATLHALRGVAGGIRRATAPTAAGAVASL